MAKKEAEPRHRKPADRRRTEHLRVRLTPRELELLREAAERSNLLVSEWVVERLMRTAREELLAKAR
jgi:uncharacterized protein (DUF1778 family)